MQDHIEGFDGNAELPRTFLSRDLTQDTQADRLGVAGVQPAEHSVHPGSGDGQIVLLKGIGISRVMVGTLELPFEIGRLEKYFTLAGSKLVQGDTEGHYAEPGVEPDVLPGELFEALDHL